MAKVTLKQNGNIEVKVGALSPMIIGTWKVVSTWEHQGNQHNLFERKLWQATFKNGQNMPIAYTRKELVDIIKSYI